MGFAGYLCELCRGWYPLLSEVLRGHVCDEPTVTFRAVVTGSYAEVGVLIWR